MAAPTPQTKKLRKRFNWQVSDVVRRVMTRWLNLRARISGRGYYCGALCGESEYNITINSDRTVSCNCQDYEGKGHLGDLRKNSFEEIFFGPVAQRFRDELAAGRLPIDTCARCGDLQRLGPGQRQAPPVRLPYRGLLLENTVRCNVDCVGCLREGAAAIRVNGQQQMPLSELSEMADLTARLGLQQIFYLNLGEPFLSPSICQELPLLRAKNPKTRIVISTNGVLLNTDAKREASLHASQILFSIHGISDPMLKIYMKRAKFDEAFQAMKDLVAYRDALGSKTPVVEWKYVLFNWNDHPDHVRQAIEMAKAAKVDILSFWPTSNPFYGISWRYRLGRFKNVGTACWKGREIIFRPVDQAPHLNTASDNPAKLSV
jgi:MoaA/NifB/PqqE/SkfB family radical SAM enzyme